jgi:hypothetical protein
LLRKVFSILLSGTFLLVPLGFRSAKAQTGKVGEADQIRTKVERLGVGRSSRVEVKMQDGTRVKGYVSKLEPDSFDVTDLDSGAAQTLAFAQVTQVKKVNGGPSKRTWIIIGAAAVAAIVIGVTVVKPVLCDGGAGC